MDALKSLLLLLVLGLAPIAEAREAAPPGLDDLWKKYFNGKPAAARVDFGSAEDLLLNRPKGCSEARSIQRLVRSSLRGGESWLFEVIRLLNSDENERPQCFQHAATLYLIASLELMDLRRHQQGERDRSDQSGAAKFSRFLQKTRGQLPQGEGIGKLALLAVFLANQNRISYLSEFTRQRLGSVWLEPDPHVRSTQLGEGLAISKFRTLGTFDCEDSRIWLDPYQGPYDLAATFVHEVGHLFRDRSLWFGKEFAKFDSKEWGQLLLLDESTSVFQAAYEQARIGEGVPGWRPPTGDFHYYQPYGKFVDLWRLTAADARRNWHRFFLNVFSQFSSVDDLETTEFTEKAKRIILDTIKPGYFVFDEKLSAEQKAAAAADLDPPYNWLDAPTELDPLGDWMSEILEEYLTLPNVRPALSILDHLAKHFPKPGESQDPLQRASVSPVCKESLKAAMAGKIKYYVGLQYNVTQRPEGGGGSRPEGGGGSRPEGGGGSRPEGGGGSRPSVFSRPCQRVPM